MTVDEVEAKRMEEREVVTSRWMLRWRMEDDSSGNMYDVLQTGDTPSPDTDYDDRVSTAQRNRALL